MVKHVILWKLRDEIPEAERPALILEAKTRLEALGGKIPGMYYISVRTDKLSSSSADMMLETLFADADALAGYQKNPLHLEAATFVRSIVGTRLCLDYDV